MTEFSFSMTPGEYYQGFKFRKKKLKAYPKMSIIFVSVAAVIFFGIAVVESESLLSIIMMAVFAAAIIASGVIFQKNAVKNEFRMSPLQNGEFTLRFFDEGIEIIGSFEKIFAPWKGIFAVEDTKDLLKILPCRNSRTYVINKGRTDRKIMAEFLEMLKNNGGTGVKISD